MSDKVFVDTNILIYTCDRSEPKKQQQALEVLDRLVSTAISKVEAYEYIQDYISAWEVITITPMIVLEAARGVCSYQLSFWDAQLWATAWLNQISVIYSEDFNSGATIEGVRFINPLG